MPLDREVYTKCTWYHSNTEKYTLYSEYDSTILFTGLECCNNSHYMMRMWKITQYYHQMLQKVEAILNLQGLLDFPFHQVHLHYQWTPTSLKPVAFSVWQQVQRKKFVFTRGTYHLHSWNMVSASLQKMWGVIWGHAIFQLFLVLSS